MLHHARHLKYPLSDKHLNREKNRDPLKDNLIISQEIGGIMNTPSTTSDPVKQSPRKKKNSQSNPSCKNQNIDKPSICPRFTKSTLKQKAYRAAQIKKNNEHLKTLTSRNEPSSPRKPKNVPARPLRKYTSQRDAAPPEGVKRIHTNLQDKGKKRYSKLNEAGINGNRNENQNDKKDTGNIFPATKIAKKACEETTKLYNTYDLNVDIDQSSPAKKVSGDVNNISSVIQGNINTVNGDSTPILDMDSSQGKVSNGYTKYSPW